MNQKSNKTAVWILVTVVGILLVAGIAYAVSRPKNTTLSTMPAPDATTSQEAAQQPTASSTDTPVAKESAATMITFTDNGFSPTLYTAKKGATIMVMNNSKMNLEFSSNNHPSHTDETELNMSTLKPGQSGTFVVTKVGEWGFHDHLHDQYTGTLVVTE